MADRLLNLSVLASEPVHLFRLVRFEGREALCEPFDYALELVTTTKPKLQDWIGKACEFNILPGHDEKDRRCFGGQIHEAMVAGEGEDFQRIAIRLRPVFWGTAFARGISMFQDQTSIDILDHLTKALPGFVLDKNAGKPPTRAYACKYDETEFEFLTRLLAQDGIMYFFEHSATAALKHKMVIADSTSAYKEVKGVGVLDFQLANDRNSITSLEHSFHTAAHLHGFNGAIVNDLHQLQRKDETSRPLWGKAFGSRYHEIAGGVADDSELAKRATAGAERREQESEQISGTSSVPELFAGGTFRNAADRKPSRLVLTSVTHSCSDPDDGSDGFYRNSFTAIDATRTFRAPIPTNRRRAPGPIHAIVDDGKSGLGTPAVDDKSRIPVMVVHAHPKPKPIWLPVQQAWSHNSFGAQFIPRTGTVVLIDFLYGDPDLPFVAGCFYTPDFKYPFNLPAEASRTGWRSNTVKAGKIYQEIMFEDKDGGEEIHIYTGRNYRRQIDKDELATINENNTKLVKKNQELTVKGKRDATIEQTQTVLVHQKALYESKSEIEIKVGASSITLKPDSIEIKSPKITIKADATIDVKAGAKYSEQAPMTEIKGDATVIVQGGIVKIN